MVSLFMAGEGNEMSFKISSNPNPSVIAPGLALHLLHPPWDKKNNRFGHKPLAWAVLFIHPILSSQHSAVDIEHHSSQETSESSHIHMAVRGTSLQFFFLEIFKKEKGKKIFKSFPTLPPSPSCLLLAGKQGLP